ncbi:MULTISPECIES: DUF2797 domain-containing protein [Streptomyces]|uniref:DUF2797 domain-containing protein n=1 Tax=Streptomyces TaxID=1883 RepID=UPI0006FB728E|nr:MULTISPECIES: DUF2797 domain-containing protein [unclassified Streptomyces]KQX77946.1 hypothetical protein ASD26_17295 [Streptomyces sp. Root1319]KQZ10162.1 hypothetical protein ASD51_07760 [Streptomyces sp. Root55]MDX3067014.1 DUF2797 domain-containing protein [Streptomyces sp. ND04-05B]
MGWQSTGLSWPHDGPVLGWRRSDGAGRGRMSVLAYGKELGFRAEGERRCTGARGNPCPLAAVVPVRTTGPRCPECARLDRAHSVAADTIADDPRPYRVYLAWFGPGMVKVGITRESREAARLREQGAVVFTWLGRGPLMAARRTEEVLRSALGVPDRIPYARKRAVRGELPGVVERAAEVEGLYRRAVALEGSGWPETLERLPFEAVDHAGAFGLDTVGASAGAVSGRVVTGLADGGAVGGRLVAAAGPDLHLETAADGFVVLDTRLITGWDLVGGDARAVLSVPVTAAGGGGVQDGLF